MKSINFPLKFIVLQDILFCRICFSAGYIVLQDILSCRIYCSAGYVVLQDILFCRVCYSAGYIVLQVMLFCRIYEFNWLTQFGELEVSQKTSKCLGWNSGVKVLTKAILWQMGASHSKVAEYSLFLHSNSVSLCEYFQTFSLTFSVKSFALPSHFKVCCIQVIFYVEISIVYDGSGNVILKLCSNSFNYCWAHRWMQNLSVITNAFLRHFPFQTVSCVVGEPVFNPLNTELNPICK